MEVGSGDNNEYMETDNDNLDQMFRDIEEDFVMSTIRYLRTWSMILKNCCFMVV